MQTLKHPDIKCNLIIMIVQWTVCSFNFYLLYFIASSFENGFVTSLGVGSADIIACTIGSVLVSYVGSQRALTYTFALASTGGLITLMYGLSH